MLFVTGGRHHVCSGILGYSSSSPSLDGPNDVHFTGNSTRRHSRYTRLPSTRNEADICSRRSPPTSSASTPEIIYRFTISQLATLLLGYPRRARTRDEEPDDDALPTRPHGLTKAFLDKASESSTDALFNVPNRFPQILTLQEAAAARLQGLHLRTTVVEDVGVAVSSSASASRTTTCFSAIGPGLTCLSSS